MQTFPISRRIKFNQIYPPELQLNKANTTDSEVPVLDLHLSIADGFVTPKILINAMTLILIVFFPFWGGDVPRLAYNGTYKFTF